MPLRDGLIYLWELDEGSGTRFDAMGNMDLSTITSAPVNQPGINGNAIVLDGTQAVSRSGVAALTAGQNVFNISFWVYPTNIGVLQQAVLTFAHAGSVIAKSARFANTSGNFTFSFVDDNGSTRQAGAAAPTNDAWSHYFIRYVRNEAVYVYKNMGNPGVGAVGDFPYSTNVTSPATYIGGRNTTTDRFTGRIDQVAIWLRDLSYNERAELYNHGLGTDLMKPLIFYSHRHALLQAGAKLASALPVSALYSNRKSILHAAALVSQSAAHPWYTELRRRVLVLGAGVVHELGRPAARIRRSIWRT